MTDEQIQESVKEWITQKHRNGKPLGRAFSDIMDSAQNAIRTLSDLIQDRQAALEGVDNSQMAEALSFFYDLAHQEERILVFADKLKRSGWKPGA